MQPRPFEGADSFALVLPPEIPELAGVLPLLKLERAELAAELEQATPEERAELERELALDPLAEDPEDGFGKARVAFGPFRVLATLELLVFGDVIREEALAWLGG